MLSNRILLFLLALPAFLQPACSQNAGPAATQLSGVVALREGWAPRLYLVGPEYYKQLISPFEGRLVDSAELAPDGTFTFRHLEQIREKGLYLLFAQPAGSRYYNEILPEAENYACLALGPGIRTRLSGNVWELGRSYRLEEADADSRILATLRDCRMPLQSENAPAPAPTDEEADWHTGSAVPLAVQHALDSFLDTTQSLLPAFAALRLRAPENEFRDRPEFFLRILHRLQARAPEHPWTAQLGVFLDASRLPVLQGERMPDFALSTPEGDTLRYSDLHATLLLVDFWASWCAPCRAEMRATIGPLYQQYHGQGFNVLGVSIDRSREAWMSAIRKEEAVWPNVSDLLGDASPVRQSLKFEYIPANYLLDAEGRLLARNLHGTALRDFVERYLAQR